MASAVPVQFADNGHWYERIDDFLNWQDAKAAAEAAGGYLATVTSAAENIFITTNAELGQAADYASNPALSTPIQYHWLGGFIDAVGAPWAWVTGEPFVYDNWADFEPNNAGGNDEVLVESRLLFDHGYSADGKQWNDFFPTAETGYIIEWDSNPNLVPEGGATFVLLIGALPLVLGLRRRWR